MISAANSAPFKRPCPVVANGPVRGKMTPIRISFCAQAREVKDKTITIAKKTLRNFHMAASYISF
jgi:hypothetical protein